MKRLDLADLVALGAEAAEVDAAKLLELLDTAEVAALLVEAGPPRAPHEAAAALLAGLVALAPLPTGNRRLAVLTAIHLFAVNGLDVDLDVTETREVLDAVAAGGADASAVAAWLDPLVTARDPLDGALRAVLSSDADRALALALDRVRRHGRRLATPADVLLGVFREGRGPGAVALGAEFDREPVRAPLRLLLPAGMPAFERATRKALELAFRAATVLGHHELNSGHLLLGLLDAGPADLPEELDAGDVRRRVLDLLGPPDPSSADDEVTVRLEALVARLRAVDPTTVAELQVVVDRQRAGVDRLVEMIRAWRGEIFLDAMARDDAVVALVGQARLEGTPRQDALDRRLLDKYLADIAQYPALTREEERALATSSRTGPHQEAEASRRRLIQCNLALVVSIARKFQPSGLRLLDLIQEGNLGLMHAVEHYDPAKGYRFTTYASWHIRRYVQRAVGRPRA